MDISEIKAMTFDVFGTVVDWRGSIIGEGRDVWTAKGVDVDWDRFADEWRGGYGPAMNRVRTGDLPWMNIDSLHRLILDDLLERHQVTGLSEVDKQELNRVWHRLNPWPDVSSGLGRLRQQAVVASLSNGKHGPVGQHGQTWRTVLGTVSFRQSWPSITSRTRKCTRWRLRYWGWSLVRY